MAHRTMRSSAQNSIKFVVQVFRLVLFQAKLNQVCCLSLLFNTLFEAIAAIDCSLPRSLII